MVAEIMIIALSSTAGVLAFAYREAKGRLAQSDALARRRQENIDRLHSRLTDLDAANCQLITRLAKFEPKHGADGKFTTKRGVK